MSDSTFVPAIFYRDPRAALAWLEKAFGFETIMVIEPADGDVKMSHYEMSFAGRGRIMVGAEWADWSKSPDSVQGANTQNLHVSVENDIDAHCERARTAGATITSEPEDQFYGDRTYSAVDPEGHVWTFGMHVRDVSREEAEQTSGLKIEGWT
ncbi:MAG: Glyoxalase/bleomycin resistance protein/dioxygenase [Chloroflexi bacterium]|nr:Glyoxalase/bleomycin resistance protein/dioxygenase [Chloroflexota bacterium]